MSGATKLLSSIAVLAVLTASVLQSQTAPSLFTDVGSGDPNKDFATVLHYSNPNITYDSSVTGIPGEANNALTIESSAPIVGTFRRPFPYLIFKDGFETGDLIVWSGTEEF